MPLSERTRTIPSAGELPNTASDMTDMYQWELGDPEPDGTHAQSDAAFMRYRDDMRIGKEQANAYKHNMVFIDTFKAVSQQLEELK